MTWTHFVSLNLSTIFFSKISQVLTIILFFRILFREGMPPDPPSFAMLTAQHTAVTKKSRGNTEPHCLLADA